MVTSKKSKEGSKVGVKGWKGNSKDGKFLCQLLKTKKISAGMTPGALREMYPQFNVYKSGSFAAGLRRVKMKFGINVRGETDDEEDEEDEDIDDVLASDEDEDGLDAVETAPRSADRSSGTVGAPSLAGRVVTSISGAHGVWVPNWIKSVYKDTSMLQHQVLLILLPGGVGHAASEDIELNLETLGGDTYLAIGIDVPSWVAQGTFIRQLERALKADAEKVWTTMSEDDEDEAREQFNENFVLMSHAIKEQLALMRPNPGVPVLKASARIKLDFPVKPLTDNDWHFVGNQTGARLLFVDLKAPKTCSYKKSKVKAVQIAGANA